MDVKSDFMNKEIEEEMYVCQSLDFEDPIIPKFIYLLLKTLYGLKKTQPGMTVENHFTRGFVDRKLHINVNSSSILVQIYIDDIIFGSTDEKFC